MPRLICCPARCRAAVGGQRAWCGSLWQKVCSVVQRHWCAAADLLSGALPRDGPVLVFVLIVVQMIPGIVMANAPYTARVQQARCGSLWQKPARPRSITGAPYRRGG
ncbi:hypothetical protein VA596_22525 [Amycolatopsis sp., V23-08]|uniref:Uncharacterized protein n=1 Tax=Amycolatopsis heterodermiae TaxID=3110235 RepID=A0ABU5R905_9PSEU|nr:hypothetical protein [Amycolatopsis sp., V23-08]MEA5362330.1 hypothetical protein [Amycolatopsis sp., V23-08]